MASATIELPHGWRLSQRAVVFSRTSGPPDVLSTRWYVDMPRWAADRVEAVRVSGTIYNHQCAEHQDFSRLPRLFPGGYATSLDAMQAVRKFVEGCEQAGLDMTPPLIDVTVMVWA